MFLKPFFLLVLTFVVLGVSGDYWCSNCGKFWGKFFAANPEYKNYDRTEMYFSLTEYCEVMFTSYSLFQCKESFTENYEKLYESIMSNDGPTRAANFCDIINACPL
ncbi:hypothetical protein L596_008734 [Steinernema carpocapsae]|uniref:Saposin B-type domain-containing protein n=1 Tax=Steinernema carpocapsae TaxID=34508 RepID=A0A4U5PDI5_STECR|nr:hypothetical protein L596_008734 [Steinernema carpocapsae]